LLSGFNYNPIAFKVVRFMEEQRPWKSLSLLSDVGDLIRDAPNSVDEVVLKAYRLSALELLAHTLNASKEEELIPFGEVLYTPKRMK
jgi:hypothetical protein